MAKKKYKLEETGYYPAGVIKQPEPSESVVWQGNWENLCNHVRYKYYAGCPHYNTIFCRGECSFGIKDTPVLKAGFDTEQGAIITKMDDVNLDYTREDGR